MEPLQQHENYRIALYYCYTPIQNVQEHVLFQKELCNSNKLKGRIRVSAEGLNGVLSGLHKDLEDYQTKCQERLSLEMDVKYCQLRSDLSVESQLFTDLTVKETSEVVSLHEPQDMLQVAELNGQETKTSLPNHIELQNYPPAPHLTPEEWNEHLLNDDNAILVDARNVYESRVGHFTAPYIPTLLTNTRKYSNLPQVLENSQELLKGKHVYMYCTGGVRCERASALLNVMSQDWKSPPRAIYQLEGGIQRYLEQYSFQEQCLYRGKNFVFDLRRTDPMANGVVGTCLCCDKPHDDYDNNHAPCQKQEARCTSCRVLVLVCNDCRLKVRSWGQDENGKPDLFCGKTSCIHEGASAQQATIVTPRSVKEAEELSS